MTNDSLLYFNYASTTPLDPRVLEAMMPYWSDVFSIPYGNHSAGKAARRALDDARQKTADVLHCLPEEIVFTASGTESNNLAVRGVAYGMRDAGRGNHLVVSQAEHLSILRVAQDLEKEGFEVTYVPVDVYGRVHEDDVLQAVRPDTILVSLFYANSEVGTVNPIFELGAALRERGVYFHIDGLHAPGLLYINVEELRVDLMSLSSHTFYGPRGIGALYIREGIPIKPLILGDGQERGRRSGMEALPLIIGFATALELAEQERDETVRQMVPMRDYLMRRLLFLLPDAYLMGHPIKRLPNHTCFAIRGIEGQVLIDGLAEFGVVASGRLIVGEAQHQQPSHVLRAMQVGDDRIMGQLRFSLGKPTTYDQIDQLLHHLAVVIDRYWGDE